MVRPRVPPLNASERLFGAFKCKIDFKSKIGIFMTKAIDKQTAGNHYKSMVIQPIEYIFKNKIPYLEGNIIEYVSRYKLKNGIIDLRKAKHYLELIAELEYGEKL